MEDGHPTLSGMTIESLSPAFNVTCADAISNFIDKKAEGRNPEYSLPEGRLVRSCVYECKEKLESNEECNTVLQQFRDCLELGKRVPCKPLQFALEACAAKNVGKLD